MDNKVNDFPQFRQMKGRKVYYKILSASEFIELSWIGEQKMVHRVVATQYPEMLRIMDMLNCVEPFDYLENTEQDKFIR